MPRKRPNPEEIVAKLRQVQALYQGPTTNPAGLPAGDMLASLCQIDSSGGRINTIAPGATAIPQRSSRMKLQYQTY